MNWNKKHDKFALACNLSESQQLVLRDALRKGKSYEPVEIEIDLRKTNCWIGKVRAKGEFHRKTITTAIAALDEKSQGMVTMLKRYNPWVYKILVRPLALVERIQSAKCASIPKLATGNPMFDADHKKNSRELLLQNISKLDSLFQKLGMRYTQDSLLRIWRLAGKQMSNVKNAVEYMLMTHADKIEQSRAGASPEEAEGITNPKGWLHDCLKYGWHTVNDMVNLPYLEGDYVYTFVDSLISSAFG
ncbi:MAG: hypothetical protein RLZZ574_2659 [Cyanobacteriota bacterium]|jgi:hypothetical protein